MSCRDEPAAIISMAQQARPKSSGHVLFSRLQLTSVSSCAVTIPSGSFSSRPMTLLPIQRALGPFVDEAQDEYQQKDADRRQRNQQAKVVAQRQQRAGPRVEKDDFD